MSHLKHQLSFVFLLAAFRLLDFTIQGYDKMIKVSSMLSVNTGIQDLAGGQESQFQESSVQQSRKICFAVFLTFLCALQDCRKDHMLIELITLPKRSIIALSYPTEKCILHVRAEKVILDRTLIKYTTVFTQRQVSPCWPLHKPLSFFHSFLSGNLGRVQFRLSHKPSCSNPAAITNHLYPRQKTKGELAQHE